MNIENQIDAAITVAFWQITHEPHAVCFADVEARMMSLLPDVPVELYLHKLEQNWDFYEQRRIEAAAPQRARLILIKGGRRA